MFVEQNNQPSSADYKQSDRPANRTQPSSTDNIIKSWIMRESKTEFNSLLTQLAALDHFIHQMHITCYRQRHNPLSQICGTVFIKLCSWFSTEGHSVSPKEHVIQYSRENVGSE